MSVSWQARLQSEGKLLRRRRHQQRHRGLASSTPWNEYTLAQHTNFCKLVAISISRQCRSMHVLWPIVAPFCRSIKFSCRDCVFLNNFHQFLLMIRMVIFRPTLNPHLLRVAFVKNVRMHYQYMRPVNVDHCINSIGHFCFLPARRYANAGNSDRNVSVCPSVCLSVCHEPVLCQNEES